MATIPEKIGRYEIERVLGQGAMGHVYLGRDPSLDRKVAIKTVRDLALDGEAKTRFLERFRNEAKAAARLSNPSIVQVFDVGDEPGFGPYLVFEYVRGHSLKQVIQAEGPLAPERIVDIAKQIASALDAAHAAGIIHRDVKPDNILIGEDGRAKLADFGVARLPDAALTREGQFLGTPCYAAPETLSSARYSPRSDLFSFAAVLYELVTGARAFPGDDAISVAHAVLNEEPRTPSEAAGKDVPEGVEAALARGLSKDDGQRFGSASEFADTVALAYVDAGLVSRASLTPGRSAPTLERGTPAWLFGVVLLIVLALGVGVVAFGEGAMPAWAGDVDASVDGDAGPLVPTDELPTRPTTARTAEDAFVPIDAAREEIDASTIDSGVDAGTPSYAHLSRHEREELAKDELDRARAALEAGQIDDARAAISHARTLDPTSSDLEELETELRRH